MDHGIDEQMNVCEKVWRIRVFFWGRQRVSVAMSVRGADNQHDDDGCIVNTSTSGKTRPIEEEVLRAAAHIQTLGSVPMEIVKRLKMGCETYRSH